MHSVIYLYQGPYFGLSVSIEITVYADCFMRNQCSMANSAFIALKKCNIVCQNCRRTHSPPEKYQCQCLQKPCEGQKGIDKLVGFTDQYTDYAHCKFWLVCILASDYCSFDELFCFSQLLSPLTDGCHNNVLCLEPSYLFLAHGIQHRGFVLVHGSPVLVSYAVL